MNNNIVIKRQTDEEALYFKECFIYLQMFAAGRRIALATPLKNKHRGWFKTLFLLIH